MWGVCVAFAANMTSSMSQSNATEELMGLMKNSNQTNATQGNLMGLIEKGISSSGMENMTKDKLYDLQSSKWKDVREDVRDDDEKSLSFNLTRCGLIDRIVTIYISEQYA